MPGGKASLDVTETPPERRVVGRRGGICEDPKAGWRERATRGSEGLEGSFLPDTWTAAAKGLG